MKRYLTLRELAAELGIPKSTVVKYKDFYSDFLPMYGEGKRKKFDQSAVDVIGLVRNLREVEKKDWVEIRDALRERFGADGVASAVSETTPDATPETAPKTDEPEEYETTVVRRDTPPSGPPAVLDPLAVQMSSRLNHLTHIVMALAGEIVQIRQAVNVTQAPAESNGGALRSLEAQLNTMQADLELAHAEIHALSAFSIDADARNKRRLQLVLAHIKRDMARLEQKIAASGSDSSGELLGKVRKWMEDHSALQTRYMMMLNENENLKNHLREIKSKRVEPAAPEPTRPAQSILGRFRR